MVKRIGILALQGNFQKHKSLLDKLGLESNYVRYESDLDDINGLIIPGGESTTMTKLLYRSNLYSPITTFAKKYPVLGTCAGLIMMADNAMDERVKTLKLLNIKVNIKCLPQQLIVSERMPKVMDTVITVANGKLSLKQFKNGTVLIGGGWPGIGSAEENFTATKSENLIGNMRLACHAIPKLKRSRVARVWLGLEAETDDAMPIICLLYTSPSPRDS